MIKVSVLYPKTTESTFDMAYYLEKHMPMVRAKLGPACRRTEVEQGLAGAAPGSAPPFSALGHMYFDSVESFQSSFGPHAAVILADIPNYTTVQPTIQMSEIRL